MLIILVGLVILVMLLNSNKHNMETTHIMFIIFRVFCEMLQIIYFPIIELFLFFFKCKADGSGTIKHEVFPDVLCFSGTNLVHIFVSMIGLVVFIGSSSFIVKFAYEIKTKTHFWLAKYNFLRKKSIYFLLKILDVLLKVNCFSWCKN